MFRKILSMPKIGGFPFYGWIIVLASFLAMLVVSMIYVFGVFIESLTQEFGWSRADISLAFSVSYSLLTFLAVLSGKMADRYGIRKVMGIGTALTGAGFLLCSQVSSLAQLYLFFGIIGAGGSTLYVPPASTILRWFVRRRGLAIGVAITAFGIGMSFFPPLTEIMIREFGWRATFLIYGIFVLVILSISSFLMKQEPNKGGPTPFGEVKRTTDFQTTGRANDYTLREAVLTRSFWLIYSLFLLAHVSLLMITVHIIPHAIDIGIVGVHAAAALTFLGVCSILGRIAGGWALDRIGAVNMLTISLITHAIFASVLLGSTGIWSIYLVSAGIGFGYGGWAAAYPAIPAEFFGTKHLGSILGFLDTSVGIGGLTGPYLAGCIYDITNSYHTAFLLGACVMAIAVVLSAVLRKERSGY